MKGQLVIVRAFGNEPHIRRVLEADQDVAVITDDEQLALISNGQPGLRVCIHRSEIFNFDQKALETYKRTERMDWAKLTLWRE